jgi:ligand-binding SRPBCC domain-containing protein
MTTMCVCTHACVWAYHSQADNLSLGSQKKPRVSRVSTHKQMVGNSTWEQMVTTTTTIQSDDTWLVTTDKKKKKKRPPDTQFVWRTRVNFRPSTMTSLQCPLRVCNHIHRSNLKKGKVALSDLDYKECWVGNSMILYKVFKWIYWF